MSLLFFDEKKVYYFFLGLVLITITLSISYFQFYGENFLISPSLQIIFILVFLLFSYFKNLNVKNEKLLLKQKDELQNLYNFQNQFFINIAHEIRTPLTILKGVVAKIKKVQIDEKINTQGSIATLDRQIIKIEDIVNNVMDLSKMDTENFNLKKKDVFISELLSKVFLSFLSNFQNKSIQYKFIDNTDKQIVLYADSLYLEKAINNLIHNALKYTNKNGTVKVILSQENNQKILIKIQDSGIGIEPTEFESIFNRFYQAENSINRSGGSGIGLAFSKEIINKHNGSISVVSNLDKGTIFSVLIPIKAHLKEESIVENVDVVGSLKNNKSFHKNINSKAITILLVEDHLEMRTYLKEVLKKYNIIEASDGLEALELLKNNIIHYILSDYMMPNMDGYEFVKTLREKKIELPVLILTARSDMEARLGMLRLGIDDYLTKPFEEEELLTRINNGLQNNFNRLQFIEEDSILNELDYHSDLEPASLKFIKDIQGYIEENCAEQSFNVIDLCDEFALSQSSLYRKIKRLTGMNIKALITEVRLLKANKLVNKDSKTIKEASLKVGFINHPHFLKLYKKRFGL
jgi:signal transduction histidine kinase/DNA-binding response OmpR family regulator